VEVAEVEHVEHVDRRRQRQSEYRTSRDEYRERQGIAQVRGLRLPVQPDGKQAQAGHEARKEP
jgi:hypothetical protein